MKLKILISFLLCLTGTFTMAQDLLSLLDSTTKAPINYASGTFKAVRLIKGYTCETAGKKDLVFSISHRFDPVNGGAYEFFGLDHSTIRFGFEYGLTDRLSLGIGRSSHEKLYDGFLKYKIFRQSSGGKSFPLTITWLSGMAIKTERYVSNNSDYPYTARMYYVHELFIARKFSPNFSAQLVPIVVHRNMVQTDEEQNTVPALGVGANYTVNKWLSFSGEYYYLLPGNTADNYQNSMSVGVELESGGGHVFQINLSNSLGMTEKLFVPETNGKWKDGFISLGFNIIRVFHLKKKSIPQYE